ncbi:MAG: hypothetical protein V7709_03995 [Halioglobus sp.]
MQKVENTPSDSNPTKNYWFSAKKYGWGWGLPSAWQGWLTLIIYFLLLAVSAYLFSPETESIAFVISAIVLTAILVLVCWSKGEPAAWRWGEKRN